jgi:hypothetical protein
MNMPLETGMAMFHALHTQLREHRCAFFVPSLHDYQRFASDLAGLDPVCHYGDEKILVKAVYEWLRNVVPSTIFNSQSLSDVLKRYEAYKRRSRGIRGSGNAGKPSHEEKRELMYRVCEEVQWWDWRAAAFGREEFPAVSLVLKRSNGSKNR